ncbi:MAG TPA: glycosyltransferase family 39 protein [Streptosporangiaceae bacterium]
MTSPGEAIGEPGGGPRAAAAPAGRPVTPSRPAAPAGQARAAMQASGPDYDPGPFWMRAAPPVAALAAVLAGIGSPSLWRDEAATLAAVHRPFGALLRMLGHVDAVHGLYYSLMWVVTRLAGTGEIAVRLPSALAIALAAAATAALGRRLVSPGTGLAAGLLVPVFPQVDYLGQDARSYALVLACAAVASYLLVRALAAARGRPRRAWLAGYGASLALLGALNVFALLLIPAHAVTLAVGARRGGDRADRRSLVLGWLAAACGALLVLSPLLLFAWRERHQISWLASNKQSPSTVLQLLGTQSQLIALVVVIAAGAWFSTLAGQRWLGNRRPALAAAGTRVGAGWRSGSGRDVAAARAAGPAAVHGGRQATSSAGTAAGDGSLAARLPILLPALCLPWLILPAAILLLASQVTLLYTFRYVGFSFPAVALIGGAALAAIGRVAGPAALAVLALLGLGTQLGLRAPAGHLDNIRQADRIVAAHRQPGDAVLYTNVNAQSFGAAYPYGLGQLRDVEVRTGAIQSGTLAGTNVSPAALAGRLGQVSRLWVVDINRRLPAPATVQAAGLQLVAQWRTSDIWLQLYAPAR